MPQVLWAHNMFSWTNIICRFIQEPWTQNIWVVPFLMEYGNWNLTETWMVSFVQENSLLSKSGFVWNLLPLIKSELVSMIAIKCAM